jgi:hypothetical protein
MIFCSLVGGYWWGGIKGQPSQAAAHGSQMSLKGKLSVFQTIIFIACGRIISFSLEFDGKLLRPMCSSTVKNLEECDLKRHYDTD